MSSTIDASPVRIFADSVVRTLRSAGFEAYYAGGCVRDLLLGLTPKDFDVATAARPDEVRRLFKYTLSIGAAFGVVQVRNPAGLHVEVATFRADGEYSDGRRPDDVEFSDLHADAARRDFTINGMYLDPENNEVIDLFNGREDLTHRIVRAIGTPADRFREDKLRMLRAVRFASRYRLSIEPATFAAIRCFAAELIVVSAERIFMELKAMLTPPTRIHALQLLRETGLFAASMPELLEAQNEEVAFTKMVEVVSVWTEPKSIQLVFAGLAVYHPSSWRNADALLRRLRASNDEREHCIWLLKFRSVLEAVQQAPPHVLKRLLVHAWVTDLFELGLATGLHAQVTYCQTYLARTSVEELDPPPIVTGDDLLRAGLKAGPDFKRWLEEIRCRQLDGLLSSREAAMSLVEEWQRLKDGSAKP